MINHKIINLLIIVSLCFIFDRQLIHSMRPWAPWQTAMSSLRNANEEEKQNILENWQKEIANMNEEDRSFNENGIKESIKKYKELIKRFNSEVNYRKSILAINPQWLITLKRQLENAYSLNASFEALP